jgi:hypothetical protein
VIVLFFVRCALLRFRSKIRISPYISGYLPPPHTKFVSRGGCEPGGSSLSTKFKGPFNGGGRTWASIIFITNQ